MRRQNFLFILALGLTFISLKLSAENPEGRFRIEEGDWFEMRVNLPYAETDSTIIDFFAKPENDPYKSELTVWLRYQLKKQRANGNQLYNVSINRIQAKTYALNPLNVWYGYDSYYPEYQDNMDPDKEFIQFDLELSPVGEILKFDSISGYTPELKLVLVSPKLKKNPIGGMTFNLSSDLLKTASAFMFQVPTEYKMGDFNSDDINKSVKIQAKQNSANEIFENYQIVLNDSIKTDIRYLTNEGVPESSDIARLINASFPIPSNTLIYGKLPDLANQKITISLEGDDDEIYFGEKFFKTDGNGAFNCPLFITEPFYFRIKIGDQGFSTFIEPNDTLKINDIAREVSRVYYDATFLNQTTEPGYLLNSNRFAEKAAYNTKFSVEMDEWMQYMPMHEDAQSYISYYNNIYENINLLFELYEGKATETCIDYFRSKWKYYLAADKLYFADAKQYKLFDNIASISLPFEYEFEYPIDFFFELDTLPTLNYPYTWCKYYESYLHYAHELKKKQLEVSVGGLSDDFYGNYYFSRATYKGFPLYRAIAIAIEQGLSKCYEFAKQIEPLYQDFITNCNDPHLIEPLIKLHKNVSELAIGNSFPFGSLYLKDSTIFDLTKYKGKPVCLVFLKAPKSRINYFKKELEKFDSDEVEFVFSFLPNNYYDEYSIDSSIVAMPNVKIIDVLEQNLYNKLLMNDVRIFFLDKWLRIVEDDVRDPSSNFGFSDFEDAVKKAIEAKRFSKQQKAAFIKTAGWSIGSILFTLLIVLWIYRVRVRNLKKREALKRQIKELEIKAIRSQMNPHFVFNALNSIQSLVNSNQYKETNIYLAKFSVLLRGVLNNSEKSRVTLSDELEAVKLYCELEQLRFEFELKFDVDPVLDSDLIEIPGMIIQPLAENAVVHGLAPLGKNGLLQISINQCTEGLCVTVSDNGVGLPDKTEDKLREKGYGLKLVEERIAILSQKDKKARLKLVNNREGQGTIATLIIPIDNV